MTLKHLEGIIKYSKLTVSHYQNGSMISMTSLFTSASQQIFCPIECLLESEAPPPTL